ncbi:MAG: hypothetical protein QME74_11595 [Candidatus Edwardsbacteria bacterium]|nr:hypothetical protein [Candidatus Edwardsbacteria bacterium]
MRDVRHAGDRGGSMGNMLRAGRCLVDRPLRLVNDRLGTLVRRVRPLGMRLLSASGGLPLGLS